MIARRSSGGAAVLLPLLLVCVTVPAHADVFEIGDGGTVHVRSGVGEVAWSDGTEGDAPEDAPGVPELAITTVTAPSAPAVYQPNLLAAAQRAAVSPNLLAALIWHESRWRADAVSPKGAIGLAQLMPGTARALAVDPRDPGSALDGGARYLRQMLDRFGGDLERGLAAYNAGPGRVTRAGGIPAITETRNYVSTILARVSGLKLQGASK